MQWDLINLRKHPNRTTTIPIIPNYRMVFLISMRILKNCTLITNLKIHSKFLMKKFRNNKKTQKATNVSFPLKIIWFKTFRIVLPVAMVAPTKHCLALEITVINKWLLIFILCIPRTIWIKIWTTSGRISFIFNLLESIQWVAGLTQTTTFKICRIHIRIFKSNLLR